MAMRAEVSVSLTLAWNPSTPIEPRDIPTVRNFLSAVKGMMRLPGRGVSLSGPMSMLEAAFGTYLEEAPAAPVATLAVADRDEHRRMLTREALLAAHGSRSKAARALGVTPRTIRNNITRFGLDAEFPPRKSPQRGQPAPAELVSA